MSARAVHATILAVVWTLLGAALPACQPPTSPVGELSRFSPPRIQILRQPRLRTPPSSLVLAAPLGRDVEIVPRMGHADDVVSLDVRADGELGVSASRDATVKVWDLRSGALLRTLAGTGEATVVVMLGDGRRAITGSRDGRARVWALPTGQLLRTIDAVSKGDAASAPTSGPQPITAIAVTADGGRAAVAYGESSSVLAVFDIATGKREGEVTTGARVGALSYTNDDDDLVSGDDSGGLKRYDSKTLELRRTIAGHAREITALDTSEDGRRVLSASADGRLKLWDVTSGALLAVVAAHSRPVRGVAVSEDAKSAVSAADDGTVKLWDLVGKRAVVTMTGHAGAVTALAAPNGERGVVTGGADGTLRIWDFAGGEALLVLPAHSDAVVHTSLSQSGRSALTVSEAGEMRLWDLASLSVKRAWAGGASLTAAALSPDASQVFTAARRPRGAAALELWDIGAERVVHRFDVKSGTIRVAAFSPRGARAITGSMLGSVQLWGTAIRRPLRELVGHTSPVRSLAISEDGARALTAALAPMVGPDRTKLWDLDTGAELLSFDGYAVGAMTADGKRAALASRQGLLAVVELESGEVERQWTGHEAEVRAVTCDRRMRLVVSGDADGVIKVWDNVHKRLARTLTGHRGPVRSVHLSGDAKRVVSSSDDGTLRMWRLDTGASVSFVARGDEWLVFSSDGYFAASPHGAELAYAVEGTRGFRLDQLGARHNRPDLLLERVGGGSKDLLDEFAARHRRRLRDIGVTQQQLAQSYGDAPRVAITDLEQQGQLLSVGFQIAMRGVPAHYQIFINGVPWLPRPKPVKGAQVSEEVVLGVGRNHVEVDVVDDAGARAIPASHVVRLDVPAPQREERRGVLHYVGIGVSRYQRLGLGMKYAHRDAVELGRALEASDGAFREVRVHTLVDAAATGSAISGTRKKLAGAGVDDTVIVFVAGHLAHTRGLPADAVFLPHDGAPDDLAATTATWSSIVDLVAGIRARRRLLIVDGCVSGDRDDRGRRRALGEAARRGLRARTSPALHLPPEVAPRTFLFQNDRMIMGAAARDSGVVVLRASRGDELCYELDDSRSGALTSAVLRALTSPDADRDADGWVSLEELDAFVVPFVANMTGGLQHPVTIRGGVEQDIQLPRVREVPSAAPNPRPPRARPPPGCACRWGPTDLERPWLWMAGLALALSRRRRRR